MGQLSGQEAGMQSRLNSMIVQFNIQNDQHSKLLLRLGEMRDSLAGDFRKEAAIPSDCEIKQATTGIVPQIADCLLEQNNHISRLEALLNDLREYI